jgi:hypothetical protein
VRFRAADRLVPAQPSASAWHLGCPGSAVRMPNMPEMPRFPRCPSLGCRGGRLAGVPRSAAPAPVVPLTPRPPRRRRDGLGDAPGAPSWFKFEMPIWDARDSAGSGQPPSPVPTAFASGCCASRAAGAAVKDYRRSQRRAPQALAWKRRQRGGL